LELIIHAGMDKCGSTAIQVHLNFYREWFFQQGVYIPKCGLTRWGHRTLFQEMNPLQWQTLLNELEQASGFSRAILSFEGVHFLDSTQLDFIKQQLREYELRFLFYLREQSQIIQSGYLQKLKRGKQSNTVADFQDNSALLSPASRDYKLVLSRIERVFPSAAISARAYDLSHFAEGNIVFDFLEILGLTAAEEFVASKVFQNVSLDLDAAELLNVYDAYGGDAQGRAALVDDLLLLVGKNDRGKKGFLDDSAIRHVRQHYADSNKWLLSHYGVDLCSNEVIKSDAVTGEALPAPNPGVTYVTQIATLARFPRWSGVALEGVALNKILPGSNGWSKAGIHGTWSLGATSRIYFRIEMPATIGVQEPLTMHVGGHYFGDNSVTQLYANGVLLGDLSLCAATVVLPSGVLRDHGVIELELKHSAPTSPASLGMNDDERELAYRLQTISCSSGARHSPPFLPFS
jgi:hypothetical protein